MNICRLRFTQSETFNIHRYVSFVGAATSIFSFFHNRYLSRQNLCRNKHNFVATSMLLSQQKTCFVVTNTCLSRQNFCHDKNDTCGSCPNDSYADMRILSSAV